MSQMTLAVLDAQQTVYGRVDARTAQQVIAALAADPETIEEMDVAVHRFTDRDPRSFFARFQRGCFESKLVDQPGALGVLVIDLAGQLVVGDFSRWAVERSGSVSVSGCEHSFEYELGDHWQIAEEFEGWRREVQRRREARARQPRFDVRQVLFGRPVVEFVAAKTPEHAETEAEEAVRQVHAQWLRVARDDLGGKAPRDWLLARHAWLSADMQSRELQWSFTGRCPPGVQRETAAYRYASFGTNEIIIYYCLVRHLLWECRTRWKSAGEWNRPDEVRRLEKLRDDWLSTPNEMCGGRAPASLIDNERRRIPEGRTGEETIVDCNCPMCQLMAEDGSVQFWELDGHLLDDQFEFSFHRHRASWDREQQEREAEQRAFLERQARRDQQRQPLETMYADCEGQPLWTRCFVNEDRLLDMPTAEFVPVAILGYAAMVSELNQDLQDVAVDRQAAASHQQTLNRLLDNLREAVRNAPELIEATLHRLIEELGDLGEQHPSIGEKCADLARRLQQFPHQLRASLRRTPSSLGEHRDDS